MKKLFIGIDFSKKTFDVSFFECGKMAEIHYMQFSNDKEGYKELIRWIRKLTKMPAAQWLFCGEHTGLYSIGLTEFLLKKGLFLWLEGPLQIKLSKGVRREKSDKADSLDIAQYAYRFQDKATTCRPADKAITSLSLLLAYRERLLRNKKVLLISASEMRATHKHNATARYIYDQSLREVERIHKQIKDVEKQMLEIINKSVEIKENYELATSVIGIALINTVAMIIHTGNFTRFEKARQLSCYAGVVPFGRTSGTSLNSPRRTSSMANKQMRTLLTQAARCAVKHDVGLNRYYHRKIDEGKDERLVINNVRNKLVHRVFAVVKNKTPYQVDYQNMFHNIIT